eukprot:TRINITY_DN16553_c0_g2_i1.p1 TRINITY_DN16553_c0_g2~~TRINITY_DN16553_c0_g2_i1.p1  ORF type:complete len:470 (+),score=95.25 TRINITY_DN16553_c0_g2_i1:133-1410(+)
MGTPLPLWGANLGGNPLLRKLAREARAVPWVNSPHLAGRKWPHAFQKPMGEIGNIETPAWLLGDSLDGGEETFQKYKDVFRGFAPSVKSRVAHFRMRLPPGKATAGPPIGPIFSSMGVKSIDFVKAFNDRTAGLFSADPELKLRVKVNFFADKSYDWKLQHPQLGWLIRKAIGLPRLGPGATRSGNLPGLGSTVGWTAYITIEMLYHIAAVCNTWDSGPDAVPLEWRLSALTNACRRQGICVLGVHSAPGPILGMTDAQQYEMIEQRKKEWTEARVAQAAANPSLRPPFKYQFVKGFRHVKRGDPSEAEIIKNAQVIDKHFQKLLDEKDPEAGLRKRGQLRPAVEAIRADWDVWKYTGQLHRTYDSQAFLADPQVARIRDKYTAYLMRKTPGAIPRIQYIRSLWMTDRMDGYAPEYPAADPQYAR